MGKTVMSEPVSKLFAYLEKNDAYLRYESESGDFIVNYPDNITISPGMIDRLANVAYGNKEEVLMHIPEGRK